MVVQSRSEDFAEPARQAGLYPGRLQRPAAAVAAFRARGGRLRRPAAQRRTGIAAEQSGGGQDSLHPGQADPEHARGDVQKATR